jgi:hypothetical protein
MHQHQPDFEILSNMFRRRDVVSTLVRVQNLFKKTTIFHEHISARCNHCESKTRSTG